MSYFAFFRCLIVAALGHLGGLACSAAEEASIRGDKEASERLEVLTMTIVAAMVVAAFQFARAVMDDDKRAESSFQ